MGKLRAPCPECGEPVSISVQHVFVMDALRWSGSHRCSRCSYAVEEDGRGAPPQLYRSAILEQDGRFTLSIQADGADRVRALGVLRGALGFPLAAIGRLRARFPGPIVSGTRGEMEWLAALLARELFLATIAPGSAEDVRALTTDDA